MENYHVPVPKTPRNKELSRDDKLKFQTLYYTAGWTLADILLQHPQISRKQLDHALQTRLTPQKKGHCGRHAIINTPRRKELVQWVTSSSFTREIPWAEIPKWLAWEDWCGYSAIRTAFKEGYCRAIRRRKPPLSEENQRKRLQWAQEHEHWTLEQWDEILWSDESWVQPGYHKKQWVTRLIGDAELYHPDCVSHKWQRKIGWMFWGCISGRYGRGFGIFWEKEWKTINKESYSQRVVPPIVDYLHTHPGLQFQQDGGPGHTAAFTMQVFQSYGLHPIFWPPFSPDLSPIEAIWDRMKDILEALDPRVHRNYRRLRAAVIQAWESITDAEIRDIIHTMPERCAAVIAARGAYTKY